MKRLHLKLKRSDLRADPYNPGSCILATAAQRQFDDPYALCGFDAIYVHGLEYHVPKRGQDFQEAAMQISTPAARYRKLKPISFYLTPEIL